MTVQRNGNAHLRKVGSALDDGAAVIGSVTETRATSRPFMSLITTPC
jgi:hypothetical protein